MYVYIYMYYTHICTTYIYIYSCIDDCVWMRVDKIATCACTYIVRCLFKYLWVYTHIEMNTSTLQGFWPGFDHLWHLPSIQRLLTVQRLS